MEKSKSMIGMTIAGAVAFTAAASLMIQWTAPVSGPLVIAQSDEGVPQRMQRLQSDEGVPQNLVTALKADEGVPQNLVTALNADEGVPQNLVTA